MKIISTLIVFGDPQWERDGYFSGRTNNYCFQTTGSVKKKLKLNLNQLNLN